VTPPGTSKATVGFFSALAPVFLTLIVPQYSGAPSYELVVTAYEQAARFWSISPMSSAGEAVSAEHAAKEKAAPADADANAR
jgi:hypothetical protein